MKTTRFKSHYFVAVTAMMLWGCGDEITTTTTVKNDGSCERIIEVRSSSDSVAGYSMPIPQTAGWSKTVRKDEAKEKQQQSGLIVTLSKTYHSVEEMAAEYALLDFPSKIKVGMIPDGRFRWFFTYITYCEQYDIRYPFIKVPVSRYLTDDEVRRYQNGEKNDTLSKKVKEWENASIFEEVYEPLVRAVDTLGDSRLTSRLLLEKKSEMFARFMEKDTTQVTKKKKEKKHRDEIGEILTEMASILKTDAIWKLRPVLDSAANLVMKKMERSPHGSDTYTNSVVMPGLIVYSNAPSIAGNKSTWTVVSGNLNLRPYDMIVTSRIVNTWAFFVTGFVVFALLSMMVVLSVKGRHRTATK
jgi:hypothetical protein